MLSGMNLALRHDHELLVDSAVAERHWTANPHAFALGGRDLVAYPLANHLAFDWAKDSSTFKVSPAHAHPCRSRGHLARNSLQGHREPQQAPSLFRILTPASFAPELLDRMIAPCDIQRAS
jgi:hypothetical protein